MSQDYSNDSEIKESDTDVVAKKRNWGMLLALPAWVTVCFFAAQFIVAIPIVIAIELNISIGVKNENILNAVASVMIYLVAIALVIYLPNKFKRIITSWDDVGLTRWPSWMDILITPAGFVVYIILSAILVFVATNFLPGFDVNQEQNVGFSKLIQSYEYILAFLILVVVAPFAEEVLFRGYLFGKLKKYVPIWVAIIATSLLFGVIHGTWNVAVDTFALSVVLCVLRELTGNIWASILLHMVKNGIAFYILFIYPTFLTTLVK